MIYTICLNPVIQQTMLIDCLKIGGVNRLTDSRWDASGKGINVSRVLVQAGYPVQHITFVRGMHKKWFAQMAADDNIPLVAADLHSTPPQCSGGIRFCSTIIEMSTPSVTEVVEEGSPVSADDASYAAAVIRDTVFASNSSCSVLVLSGSKAPGFPDDTFACLACEAVSRGIHVVADYRGKDLINTLHLCRQKTSSRSGSNRRGLLIIKPNAEELRQTLPFFGGVYENNFSDASITQIIERICSDFMCSAVITDGVQPVTVACPSGYEVIDLPLLNENKSVLNTTGCGDAFAAGLASHLLETRLTTSQITIDMIKQLLPRAFSFASSNACTVRPGSLY